MTIRILTIREINRLILTGKPVVAIYVLDGVERQGRVNRARRRHGVVEVRCLGSGRWAALKSEASVWQA